MFLLGIGELLEEWTHKKSVDNLARSMSLHVTKAWLKRQMGQRYWCLSHEIEAGESGCCTYGQCHPV